MLIGPEGRKLIGPSVSSGYGLKREVSAEVSVSDEGCGTIPYWEHEKLLIFQKLKVSRLQRSFSLQHPSRPDGRAY